MIIILLRFSNCSVQDILILFDFSLFMESIGLCIKDLYILFFILIERRLNKVSL